MSKKKRKFNMISTIVLLILFLVGLSVMLYPTVSDWWNSKVQTQAVVEYQQAVAKLDDSEKKAVFAKAHAYNSYLNTLSSPFEEYEQLEQEGFFYDNILNVSGTGIMGYITIPQIQVQLPIYHGTSAEVLNVAVGHLQGSSLPVGGKNTHAVISAHRGLPSARLFTDLDELVEGDIFTITILDEVYTYEVDKIRIVLPNEIDKLAIVPGEDRVTLMTCTPYGINTHRLLVQAKRIDTQYVSNAVAAPDAVRVDPMLVVPVLCVPLLVGLIVFWAITSRRSKRAHSHRIMPELYEMMMGHQPQAEELENIKDMEYMKKTKPKKRGHDKS